MARRKSKSAVAKLPSEKTERDWEAESDLRTLRDAEAIRNDPSRIKRVRKLARQEGAALGRIASGKNPFARA